VRLKENLVLQPAKQAKFIEVLISEKRSLRDENLIKKKTSNFLVVLKKKKFLHPLRESRYDKRDEKRYTRS
jgi:hypothetical protein